MDIGTARAHAVRADARRRLTHVLVCGATETAVEVALLLRRLGEAVTLLADDLRAAPLQTLDRAGVRVVIGPPTNPAALDEARADEARTAIIAPPGDLSCIEILLAVKAAHPMLPLVCCVNDVDFGVGVERILGVRTTVCTSAIEAVHLAGCALSPDVVGAFALDGDLVVLRQGGAGRIAAPTLGPSLTTVERISSSRPRILRAIARRIRGIRGHVVIVAPPAIAATAAAQLARISVEAVVASPDAPVQTLLRETNVARASAFVAATGDPVRNLTLGLAAREVNRSIHVVAGGPANIARDVAMTTPANAASVGISLAASAALVGGLRYAVTIGDRVYSFFEGTGGGGLGWTTPVGGLRLV